MAAAVAASDFLPIHQVQRDFRFGGRDLRSLVAVEPEPEPEPHPEQPDQPSWAASAQHPCGSREPLAAGPQPVPCATFLRAGLASDRRFPSSAGHELAAGLCALAQERARSFGQELHAPGAAVAAAQDRAGQRDVRALLQQLSGEELVQLEADGKAGAGGDRGAPAARGRRLRRLVEIARAERERAEVRLVVGVGPPCGIVFGDGAAPATASRSPPGLATAAPVVVLGFDPSVDPREGVREGMMVAEVEGCAAYGWTSAALEVVIQRAEADQTPLKLTLSHASSWIPAWQDLRAGAAVLLQSAERCRAEVSGVEFIRVKLEQLRLKERERQEALLQLAVTRLQAMHRGRSSRHDVSFYRTRSALVALQRQHRYKVKRREREAAATLVLQSFARSFLARRTFNRKKTAAVAIQSTRRALPVRREFVQHRAAACRVQSCARGRRTRQRIAKWATAAIYIERCQRGHVARLAVTWMREQLRLLGIAATTCQTKVRGNSARRWLRRLRYATLKLQALSRGRITRQRLAECHAAATSIQTRQRMLMARRLWHAQRGGIRTIQRYTRGWSTRKALAEELRQIKLAKILWAKMDEADVKEMVTEPTMENLERMIEFNNKFEGQLRALRSAAALNPRTLTSPRTRAREQQGFDVTFSEPGPLGLKFAPNKRTHDMEVTVVRPDTQAQKHKQLRPGLVLVSVAGSGVAGKTSGEVIDILKRGDRPLTLSFRSRTLLGNQGSANGIPTETVDTLSGLMGGKQKTNVLTAIVNVQAAEEHLTGGYTFHPQTTYTRDLLKHGKRGHEAPFHRRRAEGVVRQVLQMQYGDLVTDKDIDLAARTVLTLPEDKPRLRSIGRLKGQKKLMMAVNAMQARDFVLRNYEQLNGPEDDATEFDVTFSEPGPLGLKFAPNKRTHDMEVTVVRPDTQAQKHKQLRPGLVLVSVAGSGVAGKTSGEVVDILKQGGRPLTLSFWCPPEASPTDDNSFTERVRLYEHGAVPSPPRPLSARAPITPQKLTKPALRSPPGGAQSRAATSPVAITKAVSSSPPEATGGGQPHKPWDRGTKAQPDEFYAKMQAAEAAAALKLAQKKESLRKSEEAEMTFRPKLSGRGPAPTKAAAGQQLSKYPPAAKPARPTPVVHEAHVVHEAQRQKAAASSQQILDASRLAHKKLAANGRKDPEDRAKRLTRPRPVPTRRQQGKGSSRPPEPEERHPQRPRAPMPKHQAMARAAGVDAMAKIAGATHSRWKSDLT